MLSCDISDDTCQPKNQGLEDIITFKKSPSDANKAIALLNANVLDNGGRRQSRPMTVILVTGEARFLERVTGGPGKADIQVRFLSRRHLCTITRERCLSRHPNQAHSVQTILCLTST